MARPTTSSQGFTLIEVLMAATVLLVSFTAVIQAVMMGSEMIDTARRQQIAQQIIDGEIAGLRLRPWGGTTPVRGDISYPIGTTTAVLIIDDAGFPQGTSEKELFNLTNYTDDTPAADDNTDLLNAAKGFAIRRVSTDIRSNFRQFSFSVTWTSSIGRTHTRTGVAHLGQNGLHLSYQK